MPPSGWYTDNRSLLLHSETVLRIQSLFFPLLVYCIIKVFFKLVLRTIWSLYHVTCCKRCFSRVTISEPSFLFFFSSAKHLKLQTMKRHDGSSKRETFDWPFNRKRLLQHSSCSHQYVWTFCRQLTRFSFLSCSMSLSLRLISRSLSALFCSARFSSRHFWE